MLLKWAAQLAKVTYPIDVAKISVLNPVKAHILRLFSVHTIFFFCKEKRGLYYSESELQSWAIICSTQVGAANRQTTECRVRRANVRAHVLRHSALSSCGLSSTPGAYRPAPRLLPSRNPAAPESSHVSSAHQRDNWLYISKFCFIANFYYT